MMDALFINDPGIYYKIDPLNISRIDTSSILASIGYGYYSYTEDSVKGIVTRAIEDIPALAEAFWSPGFTGSMVNVTSITEIINPIVAQFQINLQNTLSLVQGVNQSGVSLFLSLASTGSFSTDHSTQPTVSFDNHPFNTLLLTSALTQNNWSALILPGVEPSGLQHGIKNCPVWALNQCRQSPDIGCHGYGFYGRCNDASWWYSKSSVSPTAHT